MLLLQSLNLMDEMKIAKDIRINSGFEMKLQSSNFNVTLGLCKATVRLLQNFLALIRAAKMVDKQFATQGLDLSNQARLGMIEKWTALEEVFKEDADSAKAKLWSWCFYRCFMLASVAIDTLDSDKCGRGWGSMFRSIKAPVNCAHFEVDAFHTFIILIANNAIHHLLRQFQKRGFL